VSGLGQARPGAGRCGLQSGLKDELLLKLLIHRTAIIFSQAGNTENFEKEIQKEIRTPPASDIKLEPVLSIPVSYVRTRQKCKLLEGSQLRRWRASDTLHAQTIQAACLIPINNIYPGGGCRDVYYGVFILFFFGIPMLCDCVTRGYGDPSPLTTAAILEWRRRSDLEGAAAARRGRREGVSV